MKISPTLITLVLLAALSSVADATQADETAIVVTAQNPGVTPFINKLTVSVGNLSVIQRVQFSIAPKPESVTRPLSATYSKPYLASRGYVDSEAGHITVPVFGLYDGYANTVALTYFFADGSTKSSSVSVATQPFDDACPFNTPTIRQARTTTDLSYDFILVASSCGPHSPTIIDTDGAVRWVGTAGVAEHYTTFFENAVYLSRGAKLLRLELDGEVTIVGDYASLGVVDFHHNIDPGKYGMIVDVNTRSYIASVHLEVDGAGRVLKKWNLAAIIRDAMIAGGDDPSGFVRKANARHDFNAHEDWTHNNSVAYRKSDDSLIISSRENFVICIDYDTSAIKWILGDTTKEWFVNYPSLRKFALRIAAGQVPPVGQHSVGITKDNHLLLFDNGTGSGHHTPPGPTRSYSAARKYKLDLGTRSATVLWRYSDNQSIYSPYGSSVYEDVFRNYLVNYAQAYNPDGSMRGQIVGLAPSGEKVFDYSYPSSIGLGRVAYRSFPVHWENLLFQTPSESASKTAESGGVHPQ